MYTLNNVDYQVIKSAGSRVSVSLIASCLLRCITGII